MPLQDESGRQHWVITCQRRQSIWKLSFHQLLSSLAVTSYTVLDSKGVVGDGSWNEIKLRHFHSRRNHYLSVGVPTVNYFRLSVSNCQSTTRIFPSLFTSMSISILYIQLPRFSGQYCTSCGKTNNRRFFFTTILWRIYIMCSTYHWKFPQFHWTRCLDR